MTENDPSITEALQQRSGSFPNFETENQALRSLGRQFDQPFHLLLQHLTQPVQTLCHAGTVGVSLLELTPTGEAAFRWTAVTGAYARYENKLIHPGLAQGLAATQRPQPGALLAERQLVIVGDEADIRELVVFILERVGAEERIAVSAAEALQRIEQSRPDVLLCDIGTPGVDGYRLIRHLRALPQEQGGNNRAIALMAYAGEGDSQQAIAAGFQQHIAKPIEPDVLIRAIVNLIQSPENDHFP